MVAAFMALGMKVNPAKYAPQFSGKDFDWMMGLFLAFGTSVSFRSAPRCQTC